MSALRRQSCIRILFFGYLADRLGRETEFDLPPSGCTVGELRQSLSERDSETALPGNLVRASVDQEIVPDSFVVMPGQEVAFIPPVSGG